MWMFLSRARHCTWSSSNADSITWLQHLLAISESIPLDLLRPAGRQENKEKKRHFFVTGLEGHTSQPTHGPWMRVGLIVHLDEKGAGKYGPWLGTA